MLRFQSSSLGVEKLAERLERCKFVVTRKGVGPDALVRAGERSSPGLCQPKLPGVARLGRRGHPPLRGLWCEAESLADGGISQAVGFGVAFARDVSNGKLQRTG